MIFDVEMQRGAEAQRTAEQHFLKVFPQKLSGVLCVSALPLRLCVKIPQFRSFRSSVVPLVLTTELPWRESDPIGVLRWRSARRRMTAGAALRSPQDDGQGRLRTE